VGVSVADRAHSALDTPTLEHALECCRVMPMPRRQEHHYRTTLSIRPDMQLGREASAAPPDGFLCSTARSSAMLMHTDARAIDAMQRPIQRAVLLRLPEEGVQHALPDACSTPAIETIRHRLPRTETLRQIPPGNARLGQPQQTIEDASVGVVGATWPPGTQGRQQRLDSCPLFIGEFMAVHGGSWRFMAVHGGSWRFMAVHARQSTPLWDTP
jgi:hypothetical protein